MCPGLDSLPESSQLRTVTSLHEIEEAIAKLPAKARRQLIKDIPEFPAEGWDAILNDTAPAGLIVLSQ
jgi:hypothetical protein